MSGHQRSDPFVDDNLGAGTTGAEVAQFVAVTVNPGGGLTPDRPEPPRPVWRAQSVGASSIPGAGPKPVSRCTPSICSAPLPRPSTSLRATRTSRWHFRLDGSDYLVEKDGRQWSLTAAAPRRADVTITRTTQAVSALIFAGSDTPSSGNCGTR